VRKLNLVLVVLCSLTPLCANAVDESEQEALKNMGVVLGWRLGPETIEEHCRTIDPAGVKIRAEALQAFKTNNARQILAVDDRLKEVAPLFKSAPPNVDVAAAVRAQIKQLVLETNFPDDAPEKILAACKVEADPTRATWTSNGRPFVDEALAALYDWKVQQTAK
jgi:hypothetical protein